LPNQFKLKSIKLKIVDIIIYKSLLLGGYW